MAKNKEQHDVVESAIGMGASFGILMLVFIIFYIVEILGA
ncbi:MAG TPA: hypothetical protein DDY49_10385 [Paenibacillaceae bacterium]|nr:hypothetical protein [Paenibacillaceae bacterium]